ncbi:ArnT family glycosyltransferase [Microlunatus endophyticus]|nr:glycosyltransferase family 39 protein [Microlunatus endophyticus]
MSHSTVLEAPATASISTPGGSVSDNSVTESVPARRRDPRWVLPALVMLLVGTGVLYLWNLGSEGNANSFYAAAVQAGSESWKAWFFGAIDKAASITVDKPPASLWLMGLSARIFGYSTWSMLVPEALAGVASVWLLYATVKRVAGPVAGLIAGGLFALTPAAVLIFRFNNPDAVLLLLVVAATYAMTRAIQDGKTRWLVLAGVALGFGFLTKSGQALLVLPALTAAYLVAGPRHLVRRIWQLGLAGASLVASAGWWIVVVLLWPASSRPYIGGSTNNSPLELAFGYNGLGRLFGGTGNGGGGAAQGGGPGGGNSSFGGSSGLLRLFRDEFGLEISWLIPAALIAIFGLVWLTARARRTDQLRAATIVWGGSFLVTGLTFSLMQGTIHPYYSVALAPSIAALVALAGRQLWERHDTASHLIMIGMVAATAGYGAYTLAHNDTSSWYVILAAGLGAVAVAGLVLRWTGRNRIARLAPLVALLAVLAVAVPVGNWGVRTAATAHTGSIPTAVATSGSGMSGVGNAGGGAPGGMQGAPGGSEGTRTGNRQTGNPPEGMTPGSNSGSRSGFPGGTESSGGNDTMSGTMGEGMGGDIGGATSSKLISALKATTTTWSAATVGAQGAAELELSTDTSVMPIGGFTGSDNAPTLAQFKAWVKEGKVTYFIAGQSGGAGGPGGGSSAASAITSWVEKNYTTTTIGGTTVYVLTK